MTFGNGWPRVSIGDVYASLYDGPHATPAPSETGPVFLGISNVTEDGHLDLSSIRHIAEEEFGRWTKRVTPSAGDIVFTYEATLNRYAIIPDGFRGCLGRRMALIRPDESKALGRFLYYYFFAPEWRSVIAQNTLSGSTVDRIPLTKFPDFPVALPPIDVQRRIAEVLSAYDDLIENNTRRIAILEEMARRLYEEWFVHFRFPGYENTIFTDTPDGLLPKGWRIAGIEETYHGLYDGPHATPKPSNDGPVFLGIKNVREEGGLDLSTIRHIADADFAKWTRRVEPSEGDIVFTYEATLNRYAIIPRGFRGCLGRRMALVRPKPEYRHFLYLHFFSDGWRRVIAERTLSGATVDRIPLTTFPSFPLIVPPSATAAKFEATIAPIMALSRSLDEQRSNLRAQRDLLLPKLVSGEIDLAAAEALPIAAE